MGYTLLMVARCHIQQGDVFYVQPGDVHYYDELGTLKLINVLINPAVAFGYLQQMEGLLQQLSAQRAACYGWLAPETPQLLPGTGGKDIFPGAEGGG